MKVVNKPIKSTTMGDAIQELLDGSEKISGAPFPEIVKHLLTAGFISGATWGTSHPDQKQAVEECRKAQKLFNNLKSPI